MNNSCCKWPRVLRTKFAAALLVLAGAWCAPAASAGAPEWLRDLTRQPLPEYPKDTNAVMLLNEQITVVKDNGEIFTTYRRAYKILRPKGRELGTFLVYFDNETRLTYLKAWSIPPDGKEYEVKEKDAIETTLGGDSLYDDTHRKILTIPAAEPGNIIGYEYEQKQRPYVLQDVWYFQEKVPVRLARLTLQLPSGWEYKTIWMQHADQEGKQIADNRWVWELADIPAVEDEPAMPPWPAVAGRLAVLYFPRGQTHAQAQASWKEVGQWYAGLATKSRQASPEIQKQVADLTASAPSALEKIRRLARFVQNDVRYVAIEIGVGGYQPHAARDVLVHRYGDCKDKVALLSAMLHELGMDSFYVLTHSDRGYIAPSFPSILNFNHVILAIRLPSGVPRDSLLALYDDAQLGTLLFFDPTSTHTPLGLLPPELQANYGLLVTGEGGQLVQMPLLPAATNRLARSGKLRLDDSGTLSGTVQEERSGEPARDQRIELQSALPGDRAKVLENFLGTFLGGFRLTNASAENLQDNDKNLILRYDFTAENYAKSAGSLLIVRPRVLGQKSEGLLEGKERKYPVELGIATLQTDLYEIALPAGYKVDELPPPMHADYSFASYESKIDVVNNVLRYERTYQVKQVSVPLEKLAELKRFYRQVAADERSSAVLKRAE